jgi:hypothetical protein
MPLEKAEPMNYPSIDDLKAQAKRLRQAMDAGGTSVSHSAALEIIAKQHRARDWNTLSALAAQSQTLPPTISNTTPAAALAVGQRIRGRYLDQPFTGRILTLGELSGGFHKLTIHFDEPVDVVTFESFSAFRQRVNAQIDENGISPRRTSNGVPHLVLDI